MRGRAQRPPSEVSVEHLYRQHGHVVFRRSRALLVDDEEARDVVQEVFMALLAAPDQFGGHSSVTTWLYAAATNACLNRLRNRRTRERLLRERAVAGSERGAGDADGETAALVRQIIERLPDELAVVAIHYYLDEMTHQEIADVIGGSRRRVGDMVKQVEALAGEAAPSVAAPATKGTRASTRRPQ